MTSNPICNTCSRPIPHDLAGGRCPSCLLDCAFDVDEGSDLGSLGGHVLVEEIARGGMGVVYRARQLEPEREVALKAILGGWMSAPEVRERFRQEARAMATLEHPAILPVYQYGSEDRVPFFTMKLANGGTLTSRLSDYNGQWRKIAELMITVAEAVQFAHERGVLHRDLKPGNILFDAGERAYVSDFGMAKLVSHDGDLTVSASLLGTPHYMAPEIAARSASATTTSDVWSLGVILFELLSQTRPYSANSFPALLREIAEREPAPLPASIPRDLAVITLKALAKSPANRYATARELADDLRRWLNGEPILARPRSTLESISSWVKKNPAVASLTLLLTVGALLATITLAHSNRNLKSAVSSAELSRQLSEDRLRRALASEADALLLGEAPDAHDRALEIAKQLKSGGHPPLEVRNIAIRALVTPGARSSNHFFANFYSSAAKIDYSPDFHWYATSNWEPEKGFILSSTRPEVVSRVASTGAIGMGFRFSNDGSFLAVKQSNKELLVRRVDAIEAENFRIKINAEAWVIPLAFHPSGKHWFYSNGDNQIFRHAVQDSSTQLDSPALTVPGPTRGMTFSPDGSQLAVKWEGGVGVWDSRTQAWLWQRPLAVTTDWPIWNPGGTGIGIGLGLQSPFSFAILNAATGEEKVSCHGHQGAISMGAFHPTMPLVATVGWDYQMVVWDSITGRPMARHSAMVRGVNFSADGKQIAFSPGNVGTGAFELILPTIWRQWDDNTDPLLRADHLDLSPDGQWLLTNSEQGIRIWDVSERKAAQKVEALAGLKSGTSYWMQDDQFLHYQSNSKRPVINSVSLNQKPDRAELTATVTETETIPFTKLAGRTSDGRRLLLSTSGGGAKALNPDGKISCEIPSWGQRAVMDISPDNRWVACLAGGKGNYEIRTVSDGTVVHAFSEIRPANVRFSLDGKSLVLASGFVTRVWETESWQKLTEWEVSMQYEDKGEVAFSPDGKMAVVKSGEGTLDLRETSRWTQLAQLRAPGTASQNTGLFRMLWTTDSSKILVMQQGSRLSEWNIKMLRSELRSIGLDWTDP